MTREEEFAAACLGPLIMKSAVMQYKDLETDESKATNIICNLAVSIAACMEEIYKKKNP